MNKNEEYLIVITVFVCMILVSFCSYKAGKGAAKREAVVAGHALWAYDEIGNPKFHWKEQQTVIGEYLGLNK
jgi:hypothetical protein